MSYVKHRPLTSGNRPATPGICETPFSSMVLSSAPFTVSVVTTLPNGSTVSTWPRVIRYGGGGDGGEETAWVFGGGGGRGGRRAARVGVAEGEATGGPHQARGPVATR